MIVDTYKSIKNSRLGPSVACALNKMELSVGPGFVKCKGITRRAWHVVAPVNNSAGNASQKVGVLKKLPLLQPRPVREIVVLKAGKS